MADEGLLPKAMRRTYTVPTSGGASAAGPVLLLPPDATPEEQVHETRHAEQFRVPGYPIMKLIEMLYPYGTGPLEQDAYRHEGSSAGPEFARHAPTNPISRGYSSVSQAYIRALLGK